MPTEQPAPISKGALWTGRVLSGLVILFLIFDIVVKLIPLEIALTTSAELGYPSTAAFARGLGIVLLICTALYAYPKTSILGAILLTGYLGGAIATHVRSRQPALQPRALRLLPRPDAVGRTLSARPRPPRAHSIAALSGTASIRTSNPREN